MIEQTNQFLNANCCFNCKTIMGLDDDWYCIQKMGCIKTLDSGIFTILDFPNGKKKRVFFCPECWNEVAGDKYTFTQP